jgi:SAM-dependent methyltransferase
MTSVVVWPEVTSQITTQQELLSLREPEFLSQHLSLNPDDMWTKCRKFLRRILRRNHNWESKWKEGKPAPWELHSVSRHFVDALESGLLKPGERCLDVGCGLGYSAAWLAERGMQVLGIDLSPTAIQKAGQLHGAIPQLVFEQADVTQACDRLGNFDAVIDRGCLHVLPAKARAAYFHNLNCWLKPGGHMLLQHYLHKFTRDQLEADVRSHLPPTCDLIRTADIQMLEHTSTEEIPGLLLVIRKRDSST